MNFLFFFFCCGPLFNAILYSFLLKKIQAFFSIANHWPMHLVSIGHRWTERWPRGRKLPRQALISKLGRLAILLQLASHVVDKMGPQTKLAGWGEKFHANELSWCRFSLFFPKKLHLAAEFMAKSTNPLDRQRERPRPRQRQELAPKNNTKNSRSRKSTAIAWKLDFFFRLSAKWPGEFYTAAKSRSI